MFEFGNSMFGTPPGIPESAKVVFVSDMFVEDYVGGAELTTQALIDAAPFEVYKLRSKDVTMQLLQQGAQKFWVFGNFTQMNPNLIPTIVANLRYSVVEYDFKFCRLRSPEKHLHEVGTACDCANQMTGKLISAFYHGSMGLFWMSEKQKDAFMVRFPFLENNENIVLSSIFDKTTLGFLQQLKAKYTTVEKTKWIVLGSDSWIKGADQAEKWCKDNGKDYEVVWGLPYNDVLDKLAQAKGFVYLPKGGDTCPRMVIEAKLLGCELVLNDYVLHRDEEWFTSDDPEMIESYLYAAPGLFWNALQTYMQYKPTISGYMTTLNCELQEYPYRTAIHSMFQFCDEVCVVDGGSTDGTWEWLENLAEVYKQNAPNKSLVIKQVKRDWNHPRFAVFDGLQKAEARALCTKEYCWQMDSDEIVHEDDAPKIIDLARKFPKELHLLALPVIEYWGGPDKVRMDVTPWKWRLSRNAPHITHGIPKELRLTDDEGNLYAREGTDGCDYINSETLERIEFVNFYTGDIDQARRVALLGNEEARQQYENWFNQVVNQLPGVFHYSWYDLSRKIRLYKNYWTKHWCSLFNKNLDDTAENNMMFDVPWSEVTDEMIEERAKLMKEKLGGWVWHRKWDGERETPYIIVGRRQPKFMLEDSK